MENEPEKKPFFIASARTKGVWWWILFLGALTLFVVLIALATDEGTISRGQPLTLAGAWAKKIFFFAAAAVLGFFTYSIARNANQQLSIELYEDELRIFTGYGW